MTKKNGHSTEKPIDKKTIYIRGLTVKTSEKRSWTEKTNGMRSSTEKHMTYKLWQKKKVYEVWHKKLSRTSCVNEVRQHKNNIPARFDKKNLYVTSPIKSSTEKTLMYEVWEKKEFTCKVGQKINNSYTKFHRNIKDQQKFDRENQLRHEVKLDKKIPRFDI